MFASNMLPNQSINIFMKIFPWFLACPARFELTTPRLGIWKNLLGVFYFLKYFGFYSYQLFKLVQKYMLSVAGVWPANIDAGFINQ